VLAAPRKLTSVPNLASEALDDWQLEPSRPDRDGADAAPYFRVFNPILRGEKFDPDGGYVGRRVPELKLLPSGLIHQPWTATPLELASAGVELGKTCPFPIINHKSGRERALAAYAEIRNASMTAI
jgi:deoxyribodipyrimidine photo-lyase